MKNVDTPQTKFFKELLFLRETQSTFGYIAGHVDWPTFYSSARESNLNLIGSLNNIIITLLLWVWSGNTAITYCMSLYGIHDFKFHFYFHFGIVNQVSTLLDISIIFWSAPLIWKNNNQVSLTAFTVSSNCLVTSVIVLPSSSYCPKRESKLLAMLLLCYTKTERKIWALKWAFIVFKGIDLHSTLR